MSVTTPSSLDDEMRLILTGDVEAIQNPYPVYNRLRDETAPVYRYDSQTVIVMRHRDVKATYRNDEHFPTTPTLGTRYDGQRRFLDAEELAMMDELGEFDKHTISRKNGTDHIRVRRAAHRYLTPRRVANFEPIFQRIFDELIAERAHQDVFDFMPVAYKLPLLVITEILGVPREEAEMIKAWGDKYLLNVNPIPPEAVRLKAEMLEEYRAYVRALVERQRKADSKSELVASMLDAADSDRLTEDELVAFFLHTLFVGHETTQHMIGNGLRAMLLHRDQWQMICEEGSLVPGAVEEIMRWDTPVPFISKSTGANAAVDGVALPPGQNVLLLAASGNRDPEVFEDPDAFDITRKPNDHVTLGFGVHFCIGASLARMEGRIVFETLSQHYPDLDFAVDPSTLRFHGGIRGLDAFPIRLGARRGD
jgi:cytochrome P450